MLGIKSHFEWQVLVTFILNRSKDDGREWIEGEGGIDLSVSEWEQIE